MLARRPGRANGDKQPLPAGLSQLIRARWTLAPIAVGPAGVDSWCMVQLAIRCLPCVPVSACDLQQWLERQVSELRAAAPHGTVRLSRLAQRRGSADLEIGWLVELELDESEPLLAGHRLADALRDMRLLGLQPTLLAPRDAWTNGRAA